MPSHARLIFSLTTLRKLVVLFRDHRPAQIVNTLRFGYHTLRGFSTLRLPYDPVWLELDITARCNLHCRHCLSINPSRPPEPRFPDMSMDTFLQILDRFPRAIAVGLGGGEPFLNPHLFEMIRVAGERCMKVHISTNGTMLSRHIDALLSAPVQLLNVSLYGTDAESFAQLTGAKGALFDDILAAVAELADRRAGGGYPRILRTSFICTTENLSRAHDLIRLSEELGVDGVKLRNLYPHDTPGYDEAQCLRENDPRARDFIATLRLQSHRIPVFPPRLYQSNYSPRRCLFPFQKLNIGGDGSIGPCCVVGPDRQWGSFLEPDVWNGRTMTAVRRSLRDVDSPLEFGCAHCEEMIPTRTTI
jgi:MoaA/NifB/PqqE/SkfB family radical SAM enzyme